MGPKKQTPAVRPREEDASGSSKPTSTQPGKAAATPPSVIATQMVVIGGGPIGLSTAYQCAKAGKQVVLLEQEVLYNSSGSSADYCRMFRTMYTESYMADLAKAAIDLWKELEEDAGEGMLIWRTGLLNFGDPEYTDGPEGSLMAPIANLKRLGMAYETLTVDEIMARYPFLDLPKNFVGLFAPDNGCINVPLLLRSLAKLCSQHGVRIVQRAEATKMELPAAGGVVVYAKQTLADNTVVDIEVRGTEKAAITTGAYVNHILRPSFDFELDINIWEMGYEYYALNPGPSGTVFPSMWFQFANPEDGDPKRSNLFYGFPAVPWGPENAARIAVDNAVRVIKDPSERRIAPSPFELKLTATWVKQHVKGVADFPFFTGSCLQTNVFDNMFVLDFLPSFVPHHDRVVVFTAGWAMKFVPMIGIMLKDLMISGSSTYDISHFKIERENGKMIKRLQPLAPPATAPAAATGGSLRLLTEAPSRTSGAVYRCALTKCSGLLAEHMSGPLAARRPLLRSAAAPLRIAILGAGASGLYAAILLESLNVPNLVIDILEADPNRIGGRLYTHHFSPDKYDYVDFGAMRIPLIESMDRVIGDQPWSLKKYLERKGQPMSLGKYLISYPTGVLLFNGQRCLNRDSQANDFFHFTVANGGDVPNEYANSNPDTLFANKVQPYLDALKKDFNLGIRMLSSIDYMTTRQFLQQYYPNTVITWMETRNSASGLYDKSISESIIDAYDFGDADWVLLDGGMSQVAEKMAATLRTKVQKGAEVTKLELDQATKQKIRLTVRGRTATGDYDHVISTMTNARFRLVEVVRESEVLSYGLRTALRTLNYDHSTKVAIKFRTRWWERPGDPVAIKGGTSSTDLPVRTVVYPTLGDSKSPAVLIASYTWAQDADRVGVMTEAEVKSVTLRNLSQLHNIPVATLEAQFVDMKVVNWSDEQFTQGAFALFGPAQFSTVYKEFVRPSAGGRLHFGGEAASHHHAWIAGSLNAAYRTVVEILTFEKMDAQLEQLRKLWGTVTEVEDLLGRHSHPLLRAAALKA